ncbi:MAG: hypothetical protein RBQ91_05420 [Acholeplasma sp.]|nr:hypothetical protein [Acholeplasma sp.]
MYLKVLIIFMHIIQLNTVKTNNIFIWNNIVVEVPLNASIEDYLDVPTVELKENYEDDYLIIEKNGINYTFLSTINTSIVKSYTHYYKVSSKKYNQTSIQPITFKIVDTEAPVLVKVNPIEVPVGTKVIDYTKSIVYRDNYDSVLAISVTVNDFSVNLNRIGTYVVWIKLTDTSLNEAIYFLDVRVKDYDAPSIVELNPPIINIGETSFLSFYTITDNYSVSLNVSIDDRAINYDKIGSYPFSITATDQSQNATTYHGQLKILDTEPPLIFFNSGSLTHPIGKQLEPRNLILKVSDNASHLAISDVSIETDLNTNQVGYYEILYSLTDESLNTCQHKIDIWVVDKEAPSYQSTEIRLKKDEQIDFMSDILCVDNSFFCQLTLVESNYKPVKGHYQALYLAVDPYGNHSYYLRSIEVLGTEENQKVKKAYALLLLAIPIGILSVVVYQKRKKQAD